MTKEMKKEEKAKPTVWQAKTVCCQTCKSHNNKPSHCNKFDKTVGRKHVDTACHTPAW